MISGRRFTIALAMLAIVFAAILYVVAYFATAHPAIGVGSLGHTTWYPGYAAHSEISGGLRLLFAPLHHVDRKWLRPDLWEQEKKIGIPLHDLPKSSPTSSPSQAGDPQS